jgi:hypothetical protein
MRRCDLLPRNRNGIPNGASQGTPILGFTVQHHIAMPFEERRHRILELTLALDENVGASRRNCLLAAVEIAFPGE